MIKIKKWDGSKWSNYYNTIREWDGVRWSYAFNAMKKWDGTKWTDRYVPSPPHLPPSYSETKTYTKTWSATWSETFDGNGNVNTYNNSTGRMYQGRYGEHDTINNIRHNPILYGIQRSMFGLDYKSIQSELSGSRIKSVEIYLYMDHSWFVSEGIASIVSHRSTSKPSTFSYTGSVKEEVYRGRGQGKWITVPTSIGESLKNGYITGFGLYKNTTNPRYYGYWHGANQSNSPKIRITYEKSSYSTLNKDVEYKPSPQHAPIPNYFIYTVVRGDSLWGIANKYGVTISNILKWNPSIKNQTIHPNDRLKIYSKKGNTPDVPQSVPRYTTVRDGEGPVNVCERLMRQGLLSQDFETAYKKLHDLNGWTVRHPILHPGEQVMYSRGS